MRNGVKEHSPISIFNSQPHRGPSPCPAKFVLKGQPDRWFAGWAFVHQSSIRPTHLERHRGHRRRRGRFQEPKAPPQEGPEEVQKGGQKRRFARSGTRGQEEAKEEDQVGRGRRGSKQWWRGGGSQAKAKEEQKGKVEQKWAEKADEWVRGSPRNLDAEQGGYLIERKLTLKWPFIFGSFRRRQRNRLSTKEKKKNE